VPAAWVRTRMVVDKVRHFINRMDFFDALDSKSPAKTETRTGVKKMGGYWNQTLITMKNNRTGHRSELRFFDFKVNTGLDDGLFTPRALMRGR